MWDSQQHPSEVYELLLKIRREKFESVSGTKNKRRQASRNRDQLISPGEEPPLLHPSHAWKPETVPRDRPLGCSSSKHSSAWNPPSEMPHEDRANAQLLPSSVCLLLQFCTRSPPLSISLELHLFLLILFKKHFSCFQHHKDAAGHGLDRE